MTSGQMTALTITFPCGKAYFDHSANTAELCKKQLDAVEKAPASSDVDRFIAHDEYGLGLLGAHQAQAAVVEFSEAITLAKGVLINSDPELAYLYLHRLAAEALVAGPSD